MATTSLTDALLADLDRLAEEAGLSVNTVAAYRRDLRAWATHLDGLGLTDLADVDTEAVTTYAAQLDEGRDAEGRTVSPATATRRLNTVRRIHRARAAWGLDDVDLTGGDRRHRTPGGSSRTDAGTSAAAGSAATGAHEHGVGPDDGTVLDRRLPDVEALDDLVAGVGASPWAGHDDVRDRALLALLVDAGPRISELVAVDVDDLRDDGRTLDVAGRLLPLGTVARRSVERWLDVRTRLVESSELALLTNLRGRRLTRQGAWMVVRRRAETAGLDLSPRTLRQAYVARLVDEGLDDDEVRRRTGDRTDHAQRRHRA